MQSKQVVSSAKRPRHFQVSSLRFCSFTCVEWEFDDHRLDVQEQAAVLLPSVHHPLTDWSESSRGLCPLEEGILGCIRGKQNGYRPFLHALREPAKMKRNKK